MDLVQTIISQLGVSESQASGGAGMLLKLAQQRLGADQFAQVANAVPGLPAPAEAPADGGGGVMGMLGKAVGGNAGDLASLAGGFSQLGLSPDMLQKFIPVVIGFVQEKGGAGAAGMLQKALTA